MTELLLAAGLADIEPEAVPRAFEELARRFAAMRDALQQHSNQDPKITALRQQASEALTAADLDTAERLLATIRERQRALTERRRHAADEARADFLAALEEEAGTCTYQAEAALLRFDVAAAAQFCKDGSLVFAEAPAQTRWRYTLGAATLLREFGNRTGRNDALLASIDLYELALGHADHNRASLEWATTQNCLGNALRVLGERENGSARLEAAAPSSSPCWRN